MEQKKYIHVKNGPTDGVFRVRKLITDGPMHDMYEYQVNYNTIAWTHRRWCTPCLADGTPTGIKHDDSNTDWRSFLQAHWDNDHNHCRVDSLEEFMAIFNRAAVAYYNKKNEQEKRNHDDSGSPDKHEVSSYSPEVNTNEGQDGAKSLKTTKHKVKPHYVQLSLFN